MKVVFTDYDPGCIDIITTNILENDTRLVNKKTVQLDRKINNNGVSQESCVCEVIPYKWGTDVKELKECCPFKDNEGFGLIIGTDLLYCKEVVAPLFQTVKDLLDKSKSTFVLVSSFNTGEVRLLSIVSNKSFIILNIIIVSICL